MIAFHWLQDNMRATYGNEPPWAVGEERTWAGPLKLGLQGKGYHLTRDPVTAMLHAPLPEVLGVWEVSEPEIVAEDDSWLTGEILCRRKRLLDAVNVVRETQLIACDAAERAFKREREDGRDPDAGCWTALLAARAYWREDPVGRDKLNAARPEVDDLLLIVEDRATMDDYGRLLETQRGACRTLASFLVYPGAPRTRGAADALQSACGMARGAARLVDAKAGITIPFDLARRHRRYVEAFMTEETLQRAAFDAIVPRSWPVPERPIEAVVSV